MRQHYTLPRPDCTKKRLETAFFKSQAQMAEGYVFRVTFRADTREAYVLGWMLTR